MPRPCLMGHPMTPAERKRRQRQRDRLLIDEVLDHQDLSKASMRALLAALDTLKQRHPLKWAAYRSWVEIGMRQGWIRDGHVTHPMDEEDSERTTPSIA